MRALAVLGSVLATLQMASAVMCEVKSFNAVFDAHHGFL